MKHEPALIKSTEKQLTSFRRIFLKDAETLTVSLDGNEDIKELHAKRSELRKMARSILDTADKERRGLNEDEKSAFDVSTSLLEDIQVAFDTKQERALVTHEINGVNGTSVVSNSRCLESWVDQNSGKAVPVLGREHRFVDFVTKSGNDVSSRDYFASMVGHRLSNEDRSQSTGTDIKGGFMVPEHISAEVIDLLRSKNTVIQAGAKSLPMSAQTVRVCRVDSDPVASWTGEGNLIPDTDMSIGAVDFVAHKLTCLIKVTRELIQDAGNASTVIMSGIASAMAQELDSACLYGSGSGQPLGIANYTTINTYSIGDNGAVLSGYDDILKGLQAIVTANGPIPNIGIMHPRTLVGYSLLKDGNGLPLVRPDLIKNMQFLDTTKIPVNQVQGTSGAVCSSIILGSFEQLVIGIRSVMEIQVLNERFADTGHVGFLATMRADSAVYQPKAFCKIIGIKP